MDLTKIYDFEGWDSPEDEPTWGWDFALEDDEDEE